MTRWQTKEREGQLTIEQVLDLAVAVRQGLLLLDPVRALSLELGLEGLLHLLELLELRLVLVRQLLG